MSGDATVPPSAADAEQACRIHVAGRVQGVYFRAHTAERARALGLRGYARNLDDGRVEVLACGPRAALDRLIECVSRGPPLAVVTGIVVTEVAAATLAGLEGFARE